MSAPGLPTSRRFVTQLLKSLPSPPHAQDNAAEGSNPLRDLPETARKQLISLQVLFPNEFVPALDLLDRRLVTRFRVRNGEDLNAPVSATVGKTHMQNEAAASTQDKQPKEMDNSIPILSIPEPESHDTEPSDQSTLNAAQDHAMPDIPPTIEPPPHQPPLYTVYYVRSAQHRSSRYSTSYDTTTTYEVRLHAWNCSCPAFAFAAFPAVHTEPAVSVYNSSAELTTPADHSTEGAETDGAEDEWVFGGVSLDDGMPPVCKHLLACVLAEKCKGLFGAFVEERDISVEGAAGWAAGWGD